MSDQTRITRVLTAVSRLGPGEDPPDLGTALAELYDELRAIAAGYLRRERSDHTLQPTALVHEAYGRLVDQTQVPWNDAAHFRAIAARVMRQVLVDSARKHTAAKRGAGRLRVTLSGLEQPGDGRQIDMIDLDEAIEALKVLHERKARVVELLFFGGMTHAEAAQLLGVSRKTVEADWYMARAWLGTRFEDDNHDRL